MEAASGDYLILAETFGRYRPDALERLAAALDSGAAGLVQADAFLAADVPPVFTAGAAGRVWLAPRFNARQALIDRPFGGLVMWRKAYHEPLGFFDPYLRHAADRELFHRLAFSRGAVNLGEALCLLPERVSGGREGVVREAERFLRENRSGLPLQTIYPFLEKAASPHDRACAALDLAALLLDERGLLAPAEAEFHLLNAMDLVGPAPGIVYNLSVAAAGQGKNDYARELLSELERSHPAFLRDALGRPGRRYISRPDHPGLAEMPAVRFLEETRVDISAYGGADGP